MVCFDVIAVNRLTGEAIRRHYGDKEAEALAFWQEFHASMTAKRGPSEEDERPEYKIFGPN